MSNKMRRKRPNVVRMRSAAKRAVKAGGEKVRTKAEWDEEVLEKRREYIKKSGGKPFPNRKKRREEKRNLKEKGSGANKAAPKERARRERLRSKA